MESGFPAAWLKVLETHSALGQGAASAIEAVERKVAERERSGATVFPPLPKRYRALNMVMPENCAVVIIGQDPYHGLAKLPDGSELPQAMGLSFSVPSGAKLPPSLRNIFVELAADLNVPKPVDGDLSRWAEQQVLLLNTVLTVEQGAPKSHEKLGWQAITSSIVEALSKSRAGVVFILWGNLARQLREHIADNGHTIIESSHPSPIGGSCNKGFFGSRPFSRTNAALVRQGKKPISWAVLP